MNSSDSRHSLATQALASHWPHLRCGDSFQLVTPGFSSAQVYRATGDDGDFCLRQWHSDMSVPRLGGIHRVLRHVSDCGVEQVPVPVPDRVGNTVVQASDRLWQLEPWMPGRADFCQAPTDQRLEHAMRTIARWHLSAASVSLDGPESRLQGTGPSHTIRERAELIRDYQRRLEVIEAALAKEPDDRFRAACVCITTEFRRLSVPTVASLDAVRSVVVPLQPCIRDLWHDHLLFTENSLTGLVDFGAVRTETIACDLSRLLSSLFGSDRVGWQRALAAYESVRPVRDEEARLLRPLDQSGVLLSGMTWLKRRYLMAIEIPELDRVSERLERIGDRLRGFGPD